MDYTLSFDEKVKGWTSFHSYFPDNFLRLKNRFYTVKDGQIYLHNEALNGYCKFYGVQYSALVETIINENSQEDKNYKDLILESLFPWDVALSTNLTNSTITKAEFNQRESRWFSYIRKNENDLDLNGTVQGIGNIVSVSLQDITFNEVSNAVSIGDNLYQLNGTTQELIGVILDINANVLTLDTYTTTPTTGLFSFSKKPSRIEGSEIRGNVLDVILTDDSNTANELFAIVANAVKSYL